MTVYAMRRIMRGWQRRLGMTDWRITLSVVSRATLGAMHGDEVLIYGDAAPRPERHAAKIRICDPAETPEGDEAVESTIIHELLHILLDPRSTLAGDSSFETGLNLLAAALVTLRHQPRA